MGVGGLSQFSDEAHRCADIVTLECVAGKVGRWLAIRLSDGGYDGVVYDTRLDAIRHQLHESQCTYVKIPPDGMTARQATPVLAFARQTYDAGFRMTEPEAPAPQMPGRWEHMPR